MWCGIERTETKLDGLYAGCRLTHAILIVPNLAGHDVGDLRCGGSGDE